MKIIKLENNQDYFDLEKSFFEMSAYREIIIHMINTGFDYEKILKEFEQIFQKYFYIRTNYYKKYIKDLEEETSKNWEIDFSSQEVYFYD